ncbi:MAG: hypothetical protein PHI90_07315, partial [Clostridia bacterium]|nr:hypothetical protein [Clostridia bacterium]
KNNLKQAVDETIILMKADNGYDDTVTRQYFDNIVLKLGLDTTKITLSGTPKIVQRGELMELKASTAYEVKGLRPFNHNITLNIIVHSEGLAHAKVR